MDGSWTGREWKELDAVAVLVSVDVELPLRTVYVKIEFEMETP